MSGTVRVSDADDARPFSGTLELMRVFEELVPVPPRVDESADGAAPRS